MKTKIALIGLILTGIVSTGEAAWTLDNGQLRRVGDVAVFSAEEHYRLGSEAMNAENWRGASQHFRVLTVNFPHTPYGQDAHFFLGQAYYYMKELDLANKSFTEYLQCQSNPHYFQNAIDYKFSIAELYRGGEKRRLLGSKQMPKWGSGKRQAIEIYEEVIVAMPNDDLAVQALMGKGALHWQLSEFRESVEAFQTVIRRFPMHELTPECYLLIGKVYLDQSKLEHQNSDILALAKVNLKKFERDFPRDERIGEAQAEVLAVEEIYAEGLFKMGQFYERIHKPEASALYYQKTLQEFPDTSVAQWCKNRLRKINPSALEIEFKRPEEPEFFDLDDEAKLLG